MSRAPNAASAADECVVQRILGYNRFDDLDYSSDECEASNLLVEARLEALLEDESFRNSSLLQASDTWDVYERGAVVRVAMPQSYRVYDLDKDDDAFSREGDGLDEFRRAFPDDDDPCKSYFHESLPYENVAMCGDNLCYKISPRLVAECKAIDSDVRTLILLHKSRAELIKAMRSTERTNSKAEFMRAHLQGEHDPVMREFVHANEQYLWMDQSRRWTMLACDKTANDLFDDLLRFAEDRQYNQDATFAAPTARGEKRERE